MTNIYNTQKTTNSKVIYHQVFVNARKISIQATKQFILLMQNSEGFGGVDLTDEGGGWYSLTPRSELLDGQISSEIDRAVFVASAYLDFELFLNSLTNYEAQGYPVVVSKSTQPLAPISIAGYPVVPTRPANFKVSGGKNNLTKEVFILQVSAPLSSAMRFEQLASEKKLADLKKRFAHTS